MAKNSSPTRESSTASPFTSPATNPSRGTSSIKTPRVRSAIHQQRAPSAKRDDSNSHSIRVAGARFLSGSFDRCRQHYDERPVAHDRVPDHHFLVLADRYRRFESDVAVFDFAGVHSE